VSLPRTGTCLSAADLSQASDPPVRYLKLMRSVCEPVSGLGTMKASLELGQLAMLGLEASLVLIVRKIMVDRKKMWTQDFPAASGVCVFVKSGRLMSSLKGFPGLGAYGPPLNGSLKTSPIGELEGPLHSGSLKDLPTVGA